MSYFAQRQNQNLHAFAFSPLRAEHLRMKQSPWLSG